MDVTSELLRFLIGSAAVCLSFDLGWSFFVKMSR